MTEMPDRRILLAATVLIVVGLGIGFSSGTFNTLGFNTFGSYWERASGTVEVRHDGNKLMLGTDITDNSSTVLEMGSYIEAQQSSYKAKDWSSSKFAVDIEAGNWNTELFGTTAISVSVGLPTHVDKGLDGLWYPVSDDTPYRVYTKTVGDKTFVYEHHVLIVTIEIRTNGVVDLITDGLITSYAGTCEGLPSLNPEHHHADVRVFFGYISQPWSINVGDTVDVDGENRTVTDFWSGVMSASVAEIIGLGIVPGSPQNPTFGGTVTAKNTVGSNLNMLSTAGLEISDSSDAVEGAESALGAIDGIPDFAVFEVSTVLEPGLLVTYGQIPNTWASAEPVDNYLTYKVRVDELRLLGTKAITGDQPTHTTPTGTEPEPDIPVFDIWKVFEAIGEALSSPSALLILGIVAGVVILIIIFYVGRAKSIMG